MSRVCELTGKGRQVGNNVSHANNKTKRTFLPNLQNVTLISDALGQSVKLRVSTHGLRSVEHVGGLDNWVLKTSDDKLSQKVRKLKKEIAKKATRKPPSSLKLLTFLGVFLNAGCTPRSAFIARESRISPVIDGVIPFSPSRLNRRISLASRNEGPGARSCAGAIFVPDRRRHARESSQSSHSPRARGQRTRCGRLDMRQPVDRHISSAPVFAAALAASRIGLTRRGGFGCPRISASRRICIGDFANGTSVGSPPERRP